MLFRIVDVGGVIAHGLIGATLARALGLDLFGFMMLGIVTALGGGMTRDVLLGIGFPVALTDPWYLGGAISASLIAYAVPLNSKSSQRFLSVLDVLALGAWSATSAAKGFAAGLDPLPCIFLSVITATFGGIYRDVIVGRRPAVFGSNPLYATFSIVAGTIMLIFQHYGVYEVGMGTAILVCLVFGLAARRYNWMLPVKAMDLTQPLVKSRERFRGLRAKSRDMAADSDGKIRRRFDGGKIRRI